MPLGRYLAAVTAIGLISSGCGPNIPDTFLSADFQQLPLRAVQRELEAPLVVVGRISDIKTRGNPRRSVGDPKILVQMNESLLEIEGVLKASVPASRLRFYYFTYSRRNERYLGVRGYEPVKGERRILFLTAVNGGYRLIGDVLDYTIRIDSGYHQIGPCDARVLGRCVAELLLTPGLGYDPLLFADRLAGILSLAKMFWPDAGVLELLAALAKNQDFRIAREASALLSTEEADRRP